MLDKLTADDFEPLIGQPFTAGDHALELVAVERTEGTPGGPRSDAFTLTFTGPTGLGGRIQDLHHEAFDEPLGIYVSEFESGRYEAIFN